MSLKAIYESFLANPNPAALGRDVSLNYITTTTTVTGADEVVKHLASQQRIVKKKSDKILSAIEAPASLVLDVETTLEFVAGGGAYLPSLDDNFLTDRVVTFPTVSPSRAMSCKIYLLLISDFAGTYCPFRLAKPGPTHQTLLGPGIIAQASRRRRLSRTQLAHSRCEGPSKIDHRLDRCSWCHHPSFPDHRARQSGGSGTVFLS